MYESHNCPLCEKMDLKIMQSLLERVQICRKSWKTKECAEAGRFVLITVNAQDQQGTHEQLSQNRKTAVDHPGNDTLYKIQGYVNF